MSAAVSEPMARVLRLAAKGRGRASPKPLQGVLAMRGGSVVAERARINAEALDPVVHLLKASGIGADVLFMNLEPEAAAVDAILAARVQKIVVAMRHPVDPGRQIRRLRKAGVEVEVGDGGNEAQDLNHGFVFALHHNRPFVIAKVAQSLDGRIATGAGHSQWITGEQARAAGRRLRGEVDAIMVGIGTVLADDPLLTTRTRGLADPMRVVLDSTGRTPAGAKVLAGSDREGYATTLITTAAAPETWLRAVQSPKVQVLAVDEEASGRPAPAVVLNCLFGIGISSVLIEGGPTVIGAFMDAKLIDRVHVFMAPFSIGGKGLASVGGLGLEQLGEARHFRWRPPERVGDDLHLVADLRT